MQRIGGLCEVNKVTAMPIIQGIRLIASTMIKEKLKTLGGEFSFEMFTGIGE